MERKIKGLIEVLAIAVAFLFFSYLIQSNLEFLEGLVTNNLVGIIIYLFLEISAVVIAPISTFPLVIIASNLWGWMLTGVLNIVGWMIGSWVAFLIARRYGIEIIKRFISTKKIYEIEGKVPKEHLFWSVVLLRIIIPADVLSYALGIFTRMSTKNYLLATLIGITPFAFIFAYLGKVDFQYQIIIFLLVGILILTGWIVKTICRRCFGKSRSEN